jgi:class 3 adenylate cyclase/cytochrome bd-type quinol oxidase subunit 2
MEQRAHSPQWVLLAAVVVLPVAGLALLLATPEIDQRWEHHPAHFWLVLWAAGVSCGLAYATGTAAARRRDARLVLVSAGFLLAAGFLGLHALATPKVLLSKPNAGFVVATPVGLLLAGVLVAASSLDLSGPRAETIVRRAPVLRWLLFAVLAVWGVASFAQVRPLDDADVPERASGPLVILAVAGVVLYGLAAARYLRLHRVRRDPLLLAVAVAATLLAEAMVAIAFARNWHLSWWEWHLLMLAGFALVAWQAHRGWHEETFSGLYSDDTLHATRDVTVLFADVAGFTAFAERHPPAEVSAMLNAYFDVAIPAVVRSEAGRVDRIMGDALMAVFESQTGADDHPTRGVRAALAIQAATEQVAAEHPGWPRFRIGVNTGSAMIGVLGTAGGRTYTAIGDAVNLASRLEGEAPIGGVAIGSETRGRLVGARTRSLGAVQVKGKSDEVEVFEVLALDDR